MSASVRLRVLLVGAGHTHLHVIDQAPVLRDAGVDVRVVAPPTFQYSGVASAAATGALPPDAGAINVAALASRRGCPHVVDRVADVDLSARKVHLEGVRTLGFDVVSFNIGSVTATVGMDIADDVLRVKPLEQLMALTSLLDQQAGPYPTVSIVGGGPTGLELAGNLAARLGPQATITVFERGPRPGGALPSGARARTVRRLVERGVSFQVGVTITAVATDHVVVDGHRRPHDLGIVATGLVANPLVARVGLGDAAGIPVRATLQHADHDDVYAVGDCARFLPRELEKVGVHGVRQGPVLTESLLARVHELPLPVYQAQRRALQILDIGDGHGVAVRGRFWTEGVLALHLKRTIDRRWLAGYR